MDEIVNKVAASGLVSLDLETYYPDQEIAVFDLKPYLFMEMILKEKDFREAMKQVNWEQYRDKVVALTCSADAIIPLWAFMLVTTYLEPYAALIAFGDETVVLNRLFLQRISRMDPEPYRDQRVVIKGCGNKPVPPEVYVEITRLLKPVVKSIMFGEPCSTVPVFKKKA